jgi:hypothetical protein
VERQLAWSYLLRALWSHGRHSQRRPARGLIDGIRRVAAGQRVVDPELVAAALDVGPRPSPPASAVVLDAAHSGAGTEEIAATAHLLPVSVRHCLSNAITKVGGRNRLDPHRRRRRLALSRPPCLAVAVQRCGRSGRGTAPARRREVVSPGSRPASGGDVRRG